MRLNCETVFFFLYEKNKERRKDSPSWNQFVHFWRKLFTFFSLLENVKQTLRRWCSHCLSFCRGINSLLLHSMMFACCWLDMFSPIWHVKKRNPWFYSDVSVSEIQRIRFGGALNSFLVWYPVAFENCLLSYSPMGTWMTVFSRHWV